MHRSTGINFAYAIPNSYQSGPVNIVQLIAQAQEKGDELNVIPCIDFSCSQEGAKIACCQLHRTVLSASPSLDSAVKVNRRRQNGINQS